MVSNIIVIAGPTASGKSTLAVRYVWYLRNNYGIDAEIINADSVQLYDELKILTAHPSATLLGLANHHLYGVLSPQSSFSAADWLWLAREKIQRLHQQNKIAIVCGGTGLYIGALLNGISNIPSIPWEFRNEAIRKFQQMGRDDFFNLLVALDPELCKTLHKNNTQRILRAYEVISCTGKPLSQWWREERSAGYKAFTMVLLPPRDKLRERCLLRIEKMIQTGAIEEIRSFIEKYPNYSGSLDKIIGYHELISFLRCEISLDECVQQMHTRTGQYAKRQYTWFRHSLQSDHTFQDFGERIQLLTETALSVS
ncbi:MAG: tRNA (adenosine(37)-N6)-dimethylallyltransferase MiaA [Holosporaceae bacterium]|nr:tRNA (adenosine(37)-N6)-dimethylallyltransferase MiaA [Holosporaceae bacterium]